MSVRRHWRLTDQHAIALKIIMGTHIGMKPNTVFNRTTACPCKQRSSRVRRWC
jgi:hypothetical protein